MVGINRILEAEVHLLWLTLADPDPPLNGQFVYSKGLIEGACAAGASLRVIGLARSGKARPQARRSLSWQLMDEHRLPRWRRLVSTIPDVALRAFSTSAQRTLDRALAERRWDAVVFDSICAGWALGAVARHSRSAAHAPKLVYVAHNHEITVARRMVEASLGARRVARKIDAIKVARLERRLVRTADLVTSNSPQDCRTFSHGGSPPVAFLPPGYDGPRVPERAIRPSVPRRAVIVGSFDWLLKRTSLERFLETAAGSFAQAGVDLQIIGAAEANYLAELRRRFPTVTFIGPVDDVRPYMAAARIALVPDQLGGFKLKGLDYVFNRVPILSMRMALPGMPLHDGSSIGLFDDHAGLARAVVELIDDLPALNARQERAFRACTERFDWVRVGRHLIRRIEAAEGRSAGGFRATAGRHSGQAAAD
jgi:polysaccharide biosynthesis protein PslH